MGATYTGRLGAAVRRSASTCCSKARSRCSRDDGVVLGCVEVWKTLSSGRFDGEWMGRVGGHLGRLLYAVRGGVRDSEREIGGGTPTPGYRLRTRDLKSEKVAVGSQYSCNTPQWSATSRDV